MLRKLGIALVALALVVLVAALTLAAIYKANPIATLNAVVPVLAPLTAGWVEPQPIDAPYFDYELEDQRVRAHVLATLRMPWGMEFLPDGRLLITEKIGELVVFDPVSNRVTPISGVPEDVFFTGQGGLMDVAVAGDFEQTGHVFLGYTVRLDGGDFSVRVVRLRLEGDTLLEPRQIVLAEPASSHALNFGTRLEFDSDGWLYVSISDHKQRESAQDPSSHLGKMLRFAAAGTALANAPHPPAFPAPALPALWTRGHRCSHGLSVHPSSGELWSTEHGEQGGDEINVLRGGANYGWPDVTYSEEYGGGAIGEGSQRADVEAPRAHFTPSIAPTQLEFYFGDAFPEWRGDLLVATLGRGLIRIERDAAGKLQTENADRRLLAEQHLRIRDIAIDGTGRIYAAAERGWLLRLESAPEPTHVASDSAAVEPGAAH